jgi:antitoxin (DNA-binding transcriptional repressor) of toxin-antitoxin stability system
VQTITAKKLHQETKSVLDQVERGRGVLITRNGRAIGKLEPLLKGEAPRWDDVMAEVWAAQSEVNASEIGENPVLAERKRRRR